MLRLIGNPEDITSAINDFRLSYHEDFTRVRSIAKAYLASSAPENRATRLAEHMHQALGNWGAGLRKAPVLRPPKDAAAKLISVELHHRLKILDESRLTAFGLDATRVRAFRPTSTFSCFITFDQNLLGILHTLADVFFVNNTNVTYPMKALLLITGLMPALDSQVRKGLSRAGLAGMSGTQVLLPSDASCVLGQRICHLPFWVGHCWQEQYAEIQYAIAQGNHPTLSTEPGRVFDILLFMQQDKARPQLLEFD